MKVKNIEKIWKDLEASYLRIGKPKGLTRSEFLKTLISYKDNGSHSIGYLIKTINDDMSDPNIGEYLEVCTVLINLFKYLTNYIDLHGIPDDIENLTTFLVSAMEVNDKVSVSDINKSYSKCNNDATEYPYSKMISQFGCVEGYSCFVKDKSKSRNVSPRFYVGYELESDKFKVLYPSQFQSFLEKNYTTTDMFIRDCAGVIVILMQLNKLNGKLYLTSYSNIKDGTLFGKKAVLKETFKYETYEVRCYSVCDFEVYCLC